MDWQEQLNRDIEKDINGCSSAVILGVGNEFYEHDVLGLKVAEAIKSMAVRHNISEDKINVMVAGTAPENFTGVLTVFVGEGDPHYTGDCIAVNGSALPRPGDPYDDPPGLNPQNNVWNGKSSVPGIEGSGGGEGLDIDAFFIEAPVINEGDTAATLTLDSGIDIWNIVYIFLSFDTVPDEEIGGTPVGVVTFSHMGG